MVIYDKVYDLTSFVTLHPGGGEVLFDCSGVDATSAFEDVCHSNDAIQMLESYFVGHLEPLEVKYPPKQGQKPSSALLDKPSISQRWRCRFNHAWLPSPQNMLLVVVAAAALGGVTYIQCKKWTDWLDV